MGERRRGHVVRYRARNLRSRPDDLALHGALADRDADVRQRASDRLAAIALRDQARDFVGEGEGLAIRAAWRMEWVQFHVGNGAT